MKSTRTHTPTGVSHIEVSRYQDEILVQWQCLGSTLTHTEPFGVGDEEKALAFAVELQSGSPHATFRNRLVEEGLDQPLRRTVTFDKLTSPVFTQNVEAADVPDDPLAAINTVETIVEAVETVAEAFSQPDPTPDPAPDNSFDAGGGDTGGGGATDSW